MYNSRLLPSIEKLVIRSIPSHFLAESDADHSPSRHAARRIPTSFVFIIIKNSHSSNLRFSPDVFMRTCSGQSVSNLTFVGVSVRNLLQQRDYAQHYCSFINILVHACSLSTRNIIMFCCKSPDKSCAVHVLVQQIIFSEISDLSKLDACTFHLLTHTYVRNREDSLPKKRSPSNFTSRRILQIVPPGSRIKFDECRRTDALQQSIDIYEALFPAQVAARSIFEIDKFSTYYMLCEFGQSVRNVLLTERQNILLMPK